MPRLHDAPGTRLHLMVVATGRYHCAGIDLESGALVRAWCASPVDQRLGPYDVVAVTLTGDQDLVPDPSEPEALALEGQPRLAGRLTGRRARKLVRPLLHPEHAPLLGSHAPTVPFWERRPDHPSVALARPKGPVVVTMDDNGMWCHFVWAGKPLVMSCQDPRLAASLLRRGRAYAILRPGSRLVVALEPPVEGHCHKVVESIVPRR
jgi:hypothetical protein